MGGPRRPALPISHWSGRTAWADRWQALLFNRAMGGPRRSRPTNHDHRAIFRLAARPNAQPETLRGLKKNFTEQIFHPSSRGLLQTARQNKRRQTTEADS